MNIQQYSLIIMLALSSCYAYGMEIEPPSRKHPRSSERDEGTKKPREEKETTPQKLGPATAAATNTPLIQITPSPRQAPITATAISAPTATCTTVCAHETIITALSAEFPPLPTNWHEEVAYNKHLLKIFHLAHSSCSRAKDGSISAENIALWQLFGRKLYSNCLQHIEVVLIINDIAQQPTIEQIVLDTCIQTHPELYGKLLKTLSGSIEEITAIAFSPNGRSLVSASEDKIIALWNIADGSSRELRGYKYNIMSIAFSPDGKTLAAASANGTIQIWNIREDLSIELKGNANSIMTIAFSPDGRTLAAGSADGAIQIWNITDGSLREFKGNIYRIASIAFSPDGKVLASATWNKTIRLWNMEDGSSRELREHVDSVYSVSCSPEDRTPVSGLANSTQGLSTKSPNFKEESPSIAFSPDGKTLAAGRWDGTIQIWNIADGSLRLFRGHEGVVTSVAFSADGRIIASGSVDKTIKLWGRPTSLREALIALSGTRYERLYKNTNIDYEDGATTQELAELSTTSRTTEDGTTTEES